MARFYYSNEEERDKGYRYVYFDNDAFWAKMSIAIKSARCKSNIIFGYWFMDSNIFFRAGDKIATATAIGQNNLTIETAAIFKNFRQKLAKNAADI